MFVDGTTLGWSNGAGWFRGEKFITSASSCEPLSEPSEHKLNSEFLEIRQRQDELLLLAGGVHLRHSLAGCIQNAQVSRNAHCFSSGVPKVRPAGRFYAARRVLPRSQLKSPDAKRRNSSLAMLRSSGSSTNFGFKLWAPVGSP